MMTNILNQPTIFKDFVPRLILLGIIEEISSALHVLKLLAKILLFNCFSLQCVTFLLILQFYKRMTN